MTGNITTSNKNFKIKDANNYVSKYIKNCIKENKGKKSIEVTLPISVVGHGMRPFGASPSPNDYIDFTLDLGFKKIEGLGKWDVERLSMAFSELIKELGKKYYQVDEYPISFGMYAGNFLPSNMNVRFVMFAKPCREYFSFEKLFNEKSRTPLENFANYHVTYGNIVEYIAYDKECCKHLRESVKAKCKGKKSKLDLRLTEHGNFYYIEVDR